MQEDFLRCCKCARILQCLQHNHHKNLILSFFSSFSGVTAGRRSESVHTGSRKTIPETLHAVQTVTDTCGTWFTQLPQQDVCSCADYNRYVFLPTLCAFYIRNIKIIHDKIYSWFKTKNRLKCEEFFRVLSILYLASVLLYFVNIFSQGYTQQWVSTFTQHQWTALQMKTYSSVKPLFNQQMG